MDIKKPLELCSSKGFGWQRMKDSNPHKQSQSLVCYHYTNPLYMHSQVTVGYYIRLSVFVNPFCKVFYPDEQSLPIKIKFKLLDLSI